MHFSRTYKTGFAVASLLAIAACGGGSSDGDGLDRSNARGSLVLNPPTQLATLTNTQFSASLQASASGQGLLTLSTGSPTGTVRCGIDLRYFQYGTVGGAGETTNASGALMIPTGGPGCTGPRPVVLYAHGTTPAKDYNLALLGSTNAAAGEAGMVAAMFAAKGYIVVAPNFAGYEASTLGYHPYLNADQQSKDMIDALTAARKAVATINNGTSDGGKLFINGYSAGGHVAMATHRAMQAAGMSVTAFAGGSGPYAMSPFVDAIFGGSPILGGTFFTPLLSTSWQKAYGNLYTTPANLFTDAYVTGIDTLLPSTQTPTQLVTTGKLPQLALFGTNLPTFNAASPFAIYFAAPAQALVRTSYGVNVLADVQANPCPKAVGATGPLDCAPAHPLRQAAKTNDLRNWMPTRPVLLCGGGADPTVFFVNSQLAQADLQARFAAASLPSQLSTLVDVDSAATTGDPFALVKGGFALAKAAAGDAAAVAQAYHGLVAPFCAAVAEGFFSTL